jgi:hypothetical protein
MKRNRSIFLLIVASCVLILLHANYASAQFTRFEKHDSSYFVTYPKMITTRFFFSKKYTAFTLNQQEGEKDLRYRPNSKLTMGIGATYHIISINLSLGFGFLNPDNGQGKTKRLDLQGHLYPNEWVLDWYGQFYKGYYLYPKGFHANTPATYYQRPDITVNLFGIGLYRVLNYKKFSFRAAFLQNEWQKKSAGTVLLGGEINYGVMRADSSFVPHNLANLYPQAGINNVHFLCFGPGVGYAYTLVVRQHFFVTGSATVNFNLGYSTESGDFIKIDRGYVNPLSVFRFVVGYNSNTWNVSVNWITNKLPVGGATSPDNYLLQTGNYRLIIAKKIMPGARGKKILDKIDKLYNYKKSTF